jgi:predicted ABC-type ATPase
MIKQIVDFSREEERGTAIIQVFMMVNDPQKHIEAIKALVKDGAIIQSVDADTIRATYKGSNQDKLLELIEDGWTFTGQDQEEEKEKEA